MRTRNCDICGREFTATRKDARTCSPNCRKRLQRKTAAESAPKKSRPPLGSSVNRRAYEATTAIAKLHQLLGDDRWSRFAKSDTAWFPRGELVRAAALLSEVLAKMPEPPETAKPEPVAMTPESTAEAIAELEARIDPAPQN